MTKGQKEQKGPRTKRINRTKIGEGLALIFWNFGIFILFLFLFSLVSSLVLEYIYHTRFICLFYSFIDLFYCGLLGVLVIGKAHGGIIVQSWLLAQCQQEERTILKRIVKTQ